MIRILDVVKMEPTLYDRDPLKMPELFLGIAALLQIIVGGAFAAGGNLQGYSTMFTGLVMALSALVSLGHLRYKIIREVLLIKSISAVFGAILFLNAILTFSGFGLLIWTGWATMVSAILSFYAAYLSIFHRII